MNSLPRISKEAEAYMGETATREVTRDGMISALTVPAPAPVMLDVYRFVRSRPDGPGNFGWVLFAAHVGDNEPISLVKTRLTNCLPRWEAARRNGHWSALAHPARINAARTVLNFIEEYEGTE